METIASKVHQFIGRFVRDQELKDSDDIFALGYVNSMFAMQLVQFVEKEFAITVDDADLLDLLRSHELADVVADTGVSRKRLYRLKLLLKRGE